MRTHYSVKHTLWTQDALMFGQLFDALAAMNGEQGKVEPSVAGISATIRRLHQSKKLEKIMAIVLRPYEPTVLHRWWNAYWMKKNGITRTNLIEYMTLEQVARVASDFFLRNYLSIEKWLISPIGSGSKGAATMTPIQILQAVREAFLLFAEVTQRSTMPSAVSPPASSSRS